METSNYILLRDEEPLSPPKRKAFKVKYYDRMDDNYNDTLTCVSIVALPFEHIDMVVNYTLNRYIFVPLHQVPLCIFLICWLWLDPRVSGTMVGLSAGVFVSCLILTAGVLWGHYRQNRNATSHALLVFASEVAMTGLLIALLVLGMKAGSSLWFIYGLVITSLATAPGLFPMFIATTIYGGIMEFALNLFNHLTENPATERPFLIRNCRMEPIRFFQLGIECAMCPECMKEFYKDEQVVRTGCSAGHIVHLDCMMRCAELADRMCPVCMKSASLD